MARFSRALVVSAAFSMVPLIFGCAEDNNKAAAIKGEAPKDGVSDEQRYAQMKGLGSGAALKGVNYGGADKQVGKAAATEAAPAK